MFDYKAQNTGNSTRPLEYPGGDEGTRTLDLCVANAPLSHLSYIPTSWYCNIPSIFFNNIFHYLTRIWRVAGLLFRIMPTRKKGLSFIAP
jgi:hypothetical protein